jgi:NADPH-dependent ferric siderophore reductase
MTTLVAEARAHSTNAGALAATFRTHMLEHGLDVLGPPEHYRVEYPGAIGRLRLDGQGILLRIEASSADALADTKGTIAGHLEEFAPGEALDIVWNGVRTAGPGNRPHNFRPMRVLRSIDLTPRMRRLVLAGEDLGRFDSAMMHVKILIPEPGTGSTEPAWPTVSASGQAVLGSALTRRTYTLRRVDVAAGEVEIDFVLHGDSSPGSRFATHARVGDWLGIGGPGGGGVPVGAWTLLAGDETALPAMARALETMPTEARGLAFIEVADAAEEQVLTHPAGVALHWVHRNGAAYGAQLLDATRGAGWPPGAEGSAWAACEHATARALRDHWEQECGLPRSQFRAASYWRLGREDGDEH